MAKTQQVNFANNVAGTGVAVVLFPNRIYTRRAARIQHHGAAADILITHPSGSVYVLQPGEVLFLAPDFMEDGAYTITANAADTYSYWESF